MITGLSFDMILRDIFLPLTSGASLTIPPQENVTLDWISQQKITFLHLVPSRAQNWLAQQKEPSQISLRGLFLAGEPLHDSLVHSWRSLFPQTGQIINFYGSVRRGYILSGLWVYPRC